MQRHRPRYRMRDYFGCWLVWLTAIFGVLVLVIVVIAQQYYQFLWQQAQPQPAAPGTVLLDIGHRVEPTGTYGFFAGRTIKITTSCAHHYGTGTDVTFELFAPLPPKMTIPEEVWKRELVCPSSKTDEVSVEPGTYQLQVLVAGGNVGWSVTIVQE